MRATYWKPGAIPARSSARRGSVIRVSVKRDRADEQSSFSKLEHVKREDAKRRLRETTPGERIESALQLSALAAELRSGLRPRQ